MPGGGMTPGGTAAGIAVGATTEAWARCLLRSISLDGRYFGTVAGSAGYGFVQNHSCSSASAAVIRLVGSNVRRRSIKSAHCGPTSISYTHLTLPTNREV